MSTQFFSLRSTCFSFGHPLALTCVDFGLERNSKLERKWKRKFFTLWWPNATRQNLIAIHPYMREIHDSLLLAWTYESTCESKIGLILEFLFLTNWNTSHFLEGEIYQIIRWVTGWYLKQTYLFYVAEITHRYVERSAGRFHVDLSVRGSSIVDKHLKSLYVGPTEWNYGSHGYVRFVQFRYSVKFSHNPNFVDQHNFTL